jgi:CDP-paratose 2-epimerase
MTRPNLITGGAGFIGSNLAYRLLRAGERVILLDNLSRPNVERNARWLERLFPERCKLVVGDVRDRKQVRDCVRQVGAVFHLAAQVAVTTSLLEPQHDFDVNAGGTLNVLEAARASDSPPAVFFTSTNKVYGELPDVASIAAKLSAPACPADAAALVVDESRPLDFHSPYGCSKGAAEQYVRDYARSFGIRSVVFRMSCIYGPRQFGTEDQGWIAHFILRALRGEPITIYGDGRQVRDALFIDDLVEAFLAARAKINDCQGEIFNIGGGPTNAVELREVLSEVAKLSERPLQLSFDEPRIGDQRYYVSDTRKFERFTGWRPEVGVSEGITRLARWLRELVAETAAPSAAEAKVQTGASP